jgi:hypothetical protein
MRPRPHRVTNDADIPAAPHAAHLVGPSRSASSGWPFVVRRALVPMRAGARCAGGGTRANASVAFTAAFYAQKPDAGDNR